MWQQNAICYPNDDDRGSAGGVHASASISQLRTFQNRLPLWTISLALEHADCILYFKTKMAGNKTMSGWDDDHYDIVIEYQSVWTCFFISPLVFFLAWLCNICRASLPPDPTGAVPLDPTGGLPSLRSPASAPAKPKSWIRPWIVLHMC